MRCELFENRLNQLLDDRQHWSYDPQLADHCAHCVTCRSLADSYAALPLASATPKLSHNFSARVLAALAAGSEVTSEVKMKTKPLRLTHFPARRPLQRRFIAVAAMLLVALPLGYLSWSVSQPPASPSATLAGGDAGSRWQFQLRLTQLLDEDRPISDVVWRSTGREIAKLPLQVRRAAAYSESAQLTGAIRPVAAAWQALWQVLPRESSPSEPTTGETGLFATTSEAIWA